MTNRSKFELKLPLLLPLPLPLPPLLHPRFVLATPLLSYLAYLVSIY
jgi:hypothetical protein